MQQLSPLEKAIDYIETHLQDDIGLSEVSQAAGYSYYHMTRLFSAVLGESVGHYINRRRLYNAAQKLLYSDQRVLDIALDGGFKSAEAFSRAFKAAFGSSPQSYRKSGLDLVSSAKRELAPKDVYHIANNISHTPEIVQLEAVTIAGLRSMTSVFDNQIPHLWERFLRLHAAHFQSSGLGYEVCETPQTAYTPEGNVTFSVMVAAPVESFADLPPQLTVKTLSAGKYAVFTHRGTFANLFKTHQYIYGTWLANTKAQLDDREDFLLYERRVQSFDDPDNLVKLFVPIK